MTIKKMFKMQLSEYLSPDWIPKGQESTEINIPLEKIRITN